MSNLSGADLAEVRLKLNVDEKMGSLDHEPQKEVLPSGIANPGVIDLFALDQRTGEVLLVMHESRSWDDSDERLHQLQEKFNAYVSFVLDGEMVGAHPELGGKKARIELRCKHMPGERELGFLELIHNQLALQEIKLEVIVAHNEGCGTDCGCSQGADSAPDAQ